MELRKRIFERIEERCESEPCDGINAHGEYSESVYLKQRAFIDGIRCGGLAAANVVCPKPPSKTT